MRRRGREQGVGVIREIVFYIEGGRDKTHDVGFRRAFHAFFKQIEERAKEKNIGFRPILEGGRQRTYNRFCNERLRKPETLCILLVDSEAPVAVFGESWRHLAQREGDRWERPEDAENEEAQLMVQAMEGWFFADPDALEAYYGNGFQRNALPKRRDIENIPKDDHVPTLENAARNTRKKTYRKFDHGPEILMRINPQFVQAQAPHCKRIFDDLLRMIDALPGVP